MDSVISAKDIHKSFGSLEVLKGVDIEIKRGEVVAIMGASGAGKSTLLQILGTLMTPSSGTVEIDGQRTDSLRGNALARFRNRHIGFVFQAHHLLPEFTARENVMIPLLISGENAKNASAKALELLEKTGLSERAEHKSAELSGGEQQRVAIARALACSPAVIFADEPSGNLDSATKAQIHQLFFDLRASLGQTIVIVTHDESLAAQCDRVLRLVDGRFVQ